MRFYRFAHAVAAGIIRRMFRVQIVGAEHEIQSGAYLLCCNHLSLHDAQILGASLKRQLHFIAKAELFSVPLLRHLVRALGAIPVKRGAHDVEMVRTALRMLAEGEVVAIFPEGTRRPGAQSLAFPPKYGAGMLACRAQVPVLPVVLQTKGNRIRLFRKTVVRIGEPISCTALEADAPSRQEYARAAEQIYEQLRILASQNGGNE